MTNPATALHHYAGLNLIDHLQEYRSVYAACQSIGPKVGVGAESLRRWVLQAQVEAAQRHGVTRYCESD
ncbi:hypothetical protein [Mycobacterium avium]